VQDPICKITKAKRTGSIAQVVDYIPGKYKVLKDAGEKGNFINCWWECKLE
jgi:hypothetical protein